MGLILTQGNVKDVPRFMEIVVDAWKYDDMWEPCARNIPREEQIKWWTDTFEAVFAEPFHCYFKIVDEDTGRTVGWTNLQVPAPQTDEYKWRQHHGMPPAPEGVHNGILGIPNGYDPEKDYHRRGTFIDPAYQKRGLGTRLTKKCNEVADAAGGRTFVPARPSSKHMFEQNGYVVKDAHHVDMERYTGRPYIAQNWLLIREPGGG